MIFHLILNSLLVFLILSLAIEFCISLFSLKNARLRYLLRLLPIAKFPFDLLVFSTYGENLFLNLNPFSCAFYVQELVTYLLSSKGHPTSSSLIIPQYIANYIPPALLLSITSATLFISLLIFFKKIFHLIHSHSYLKKILLHSSPCNRTLVNPSLARALKQSKIHMRLSREVMTPLAAGKSTILLPQSLASAYSQKEFEAVIAHEVEHLKWKDPLMRFLSQCICTLFWWIPTRWLTKRLEDDQEEASDLTIHKYGIDPYDLSTALLKTVKHNKMYPIPLTAVCPFVSTQSPYKKRLETLLNSEDSSRGGKRIYLAAFFCLLAFFSLWAC